MRPLTELAEEKESVCLRNIAMATDFSEASEKAFGYATAIARHYGAKMYVVHVLSPEPAPLLPQLSEDQQWRESERQMEDFSSRSELKEVTHELLLRAGSVWSVLSDVIRHENIDLLVLGTHGRGGLKKVARGSVAEELVRLVPCPVITVGPNTVAASASAGEFCRILFATDFGATSAKALLYALFLAERSRAKLILLHVVLPAPLPSPDLGLKVYERIEAWRAKERATIKEKLENLVPSDAVLGCELEYVVDFDFLFKGILRLAAEHEADLIVMGAKRAISSKAVAHIPRTVTHEVVCHAKCPVLTVTT